MSPPFGAAMRTTHAAGGGGGGGGGGVKMIDSAEDGGMTEWYGAGSGSLATAVTKSFAKDGSYVIDLSGGKRCSSASGGANSGGLPNYPFKGVTFNIYAYFQDLDSVIACYWCFPPSEDNQPWENSFEYRFSPQQGNTQLESNSSTNGDVEYSNTNVSWQTGQWYRARIDYFDSMGDNDVVVDLFDGGGSNIAADTANPNSAHTWDNPSIAFLGGSGVTGYVDYAHIP